MLLSSFAQAGSISAVAAELGYSASAVSQQLSALEREAGVPLMERTAQRAYLTDAGRQLVEHARLILSEIERAESALRARTGRIAGHLTVSCIPGLAATLAPALAALQRGHRDLTVTARETTTLVAVDALGAGRVDVAVVDDWGQRATPYWPGLTAYRLLAEAVVLAVADGHPVAAGGPVTDAALRRIVADETWVCAPIGHLSRTAGDERLASAGARPLRRWEFEGLAVLAAVAAAGAGVALLPASVARAQSGLRGRPLRPAMRRSVVALTRTTTRTDPAAQACLRAVRGAIGDG